MVEQSHAAAAPQYSRPPVILVADPDEHIRKLLQFHLKRSGCRVLLADTGEHALDLVRQQGPVDLALLDLRQRGMPALETLRAINRTGQVGSVIVMTHNGTIADAISAMREGAYDFVNKTQSFDEVHLAVRNALNTQGLKQEVERLKAQLEDQAQPFGKIIGKSAAIAQVLKLARKACDSDITVLIHGESGSGKEMVAWAIHSQGPHRKRPFVVVNCAAIPESLLESELFGHEKGSFTGAHQRHVGKFAEANDGTLFLDEVGELGLGLQAKLLRVLQTREIQPIGGQAQRVNVRIISATNQDLREAVQQGRFRLDLYHRLAVFPLFIPPLRQRREDIPLLVEHFLGRFAQQEGRGTLTLDAAVMQKLMEYEWQGNVRELENMIYRAVVLSESSRLTLTDFPVLALDQPAAIPGRQAAATAPAPLQAVNPASASQLAAPAWPAEPGVVRLQEVEWQAITRALEQTGGNMSQAAIRLGIGRATLYRKCKKHGAGADRS